jgi:hypothetical protein
LTGIFLISNGETHTMDNKKKEAKA